MAPVVKRELRSAMAQSVTRRVDTSTRPGWAFVLVGAGVLMSNLDAFVVNVALPETARQFHHASLGSVSWVLNAYAVAFAALLVPALHMLPGMLLTGVGVGLTVPTLIGTAVAALPPTSLTPGAGVVTMVRQLGSVLGVALLVVFLGNGGGPRITTTAFDRGWWFTVAATAVAALACLGQRGYRPHPP